MIVSNGSIILLLYNLDSYPSTLSARSCISFAKVGAWFWDILVAL